MGTPNQTQPRPPQQSFPIPNNVPQNLHIPPGKQRNLAPQSTGSPAQASPMQAAPQPTQSHAQIQAQAQAIQNMIRQGIPVNVNQAAALATQATPQPNVRPEVLLQQMTAQAQNGEEARARQMNDALAQHQSDRSNSLLNKVSWKPSAEYDTALRDKLSELQRTLRPTGRSTLSQGLGAARVLSDVLVERMPEALTAMAEEAIMGIDEEDGEEKEAGLPGQKKRKISELASSVDKGFEIGREVEQVCKLGFCADPSYSSISPTSTLNSCPT